jgi:hypothetical protein
MRLAVLIRQLASIIHILKHIYLMCLYALGLIVEKDQVTFIMCSQAVVIIVLPHCTGCHHLFFLSFNFYTRMFRDA